MNRRRMAIGGVAVLAGLLAQYLGVPAAWLIGPLIVALLFALSWKGSTAGLVPSGLNLAAQAVIGVSLSASFDPATLIAVTHDWLPVLMSVIIILAISVITGIVLARLSSLDAATAFLGSVPGGANGMVAMSEALDADPRFVAFMQYSRQCLVVVLAPVLAQIVIWLVGGSIHVTAGGSAAAGGHGVSWWIVYSCSLLAALIGSWLGVRCRLPAGMLIGPFLVSMLLGIAGLPHGSWPLGVLPVAYAVIGIRTGSLFDRPTLRLVWRLLPAILASILTLIIGCALLGWGLALTTGTDLLSAYLATIPGGVDSVGILALGSSANITLVLAVQMARFLSVVLVGPPLVRWLTHKYTPNKEVLLRQMETM